MKASVFTLIVASAILMGSNSYAQKLENEVFNSSTGIEFKVGDNITIGMPSNGTQFTNIEEHLKGFKKLGKLAGDLSEVGAQVVSSGYDAGSAGAVRTGAKLSQTSGQAAKLTALTDKLSPQAKPIAGKKLRILKFKVEGNEKRGQHFFAIVAAEGNKDFKIELEPAIESKEIVAVGTNNFAAPKKK